MSEPSFAAGFALALLELAVSKNASRSELLERSAIAAEDLEDQNKRIPLSKYAALMRSAKELSGDAALALHFGEAVDIAELSVVGMIARSAETAAESLALMNRYARLIADVDTEGSDRLQLVREDGQLWMLDTRTYPNAFPEGQAMIRTETAAMRA
jgi:hypothetical protein